MRDIITLPGIGGSGEAHWQSRWEASDSRIRRFSPSNWDEPDLEDWVAALDRAVAQSKSEPVLVAHSLSCLLVAHWSWRGRYRASGALLVAPPDPSSPAFPSEAGGFADPPATTLPFASLVIASNDDPFGSLNYARTSANGWGSEFMEIGARGHINGMSGLGDWPQGRVALADLEARLR
ncbi:RBBP9/YdeN family alpha/beta hydrolase [Rhizobium mesoamericanum]|uniref:RBBP9/YdeN family alpha/beta hydrolase n=1 Tax=Rhizobium mesoamericanum TaxID=1079800 RepID=UPI0004259D7B|nr:alpha/beta fold hydrolase [Rhizobium mesoamericanum]